MENANRSSRAVNARTLLLPYALALVASTTIIQVVVALTGGQITLLVGLLTGAVAVGITLWVWRNYRQLVRVRFGLAIAHTIAFITVTTSFNAHATIHSIALARQDGPQAVAHDLLATSWFGATLVMSSIWGLGLLIHLIGAILGRGWED